MMSFISGKGQAAAMTSKAFMKEAARGAKAHICPPHPDCAPSPTQGLWRGCQLTPTPQLHTPAFPVACPSSLNAVFAIYSFHWTSSVRT